MGYHDTVTFIRKYILQHLEERERERGKNNNNNNNTHTIPLRILHPQDASIMLLTLSKPIVNTTHCPT
jgi:hypothetical protein